MRESCADKAKWLARIRPMPSASVEDLLRLPVSLDVWQRDSDALLAAATDDSLHEIERRRLAKVERICSVGDYLQRGWPNTDRKGKP
jgi:hypothetical protein